MAQRGLSQGFIQPGVSSLLRTEPAQPWGSCPTAWLFPLWGFILSSVSIVSPLRPHCPFSSSPSSIFSLPSRGSGCCSELSLLQMDNPVFQDSNVRVFHGGGVTRGACPNCRECTPKCSPTCFCNIVLSFILTFQFCSLQSLLSSQIKQLTLHFLQRMSWWQKFVEHRTLDPILLWLIKAGVRHLSL